MIKRSIRITRLGQRDCEVLAPGRLELEPQPRMVRGNLVDFVFEWDNLGFKQHWVWLARARAKKNGMDHYTFLEETNVVKFSYIICFLTCISI